MDLIDYLLAFGKGILKQDDIHAEQVKVILNDGLNEAQNNVESKDFKALKQEVNKFSNALHRIIELERAIKDYKCDVRVFWRIIRIKIYVRRLRKS